MKSKLYKVLAVVMYVLAAFSVLVGLISIKDGTWIFWIPGVLFFFIGRSYSSKAKKAAPKSVVPNASNDSPAPATSPVQTYTPPQNVPQYVSVEETHKVAGLDHHMDAVMELASENDDFKKSARSLARDGYEDSKVYKYEFYPHKTELIPEPGNPVDPNAIKVVVDGQHIGYIKAGSCSHVLRLMREDRIERIKCSIGGGPCKYVYFDEYDDNGREKYAAETDKDNPFHAKLTIVKKRDEAEAE